MRDHLHTVFSVPDERIVDLPNGLTADDWDVSPPGDDMLPEAARSGLMYALGRAQPYEGFDDLLDALGMLNDTTTPHVIVAAVTETDHLTTYQHPRPAGVRCVPGLAGAGRARRQPRRGADGAPRPPGTPTPPPTRHG